MSDRVQKLRIAYAIQNVGGIDFHHDVGDTVPVKQSLMELTRVGHAINCLQLSGSVVRQLENVDAPDNYRIAPVGVSGTRLFKLVEGGVRYFQRKLHIPYFAFFDAFRFYEACLRALPSFDICHEHNGLFCVGAALACRRLKIPYVLTFSADPLFERALGGRPLRGLHRFVAARQARFTYKLARSIICVSEPAKDHMVKTWNVDPDKIVVMPNGVDLDRFRPDYDSRRIRRELGLDDALVIAFVGGFQHWHGIERLVESFAHVLPEMPNARLLLVGDGRARPSIDRKISELGLGSNVIITGLIPQSRVPEILAAADIAVLPYPELPREMWFSPLKLYEYMAAGKAIVASDAGQISDVIKHNYNGLLVSPGDIAHLTEALVGLLKEPAERERLGCNARQQALEQHSWRRYVERLVQVYNDALQSSVV
jgi:glycosyltransferase involved in cell wall biosynthesis